MVYLFSFSEGLNRIFTYLHGFHDIKMSEKVLDDITKSLERERGIRKVIDHRLLIIIIKTMSNIMASRRSGLRK